MAIFNVASIAGGAIGFFIPPSLFPTKTLNKK